VIAALLSSGKRKTNVDELLLNLIASTMGDSSVLRETITELLDKGADPSTKHSVGARSAIHAAVGLHACGTGHKAGFVNLPFLGNQQEDTEEAEADAAEAEAEQAMQAEERGTGAESHQHSERPQEQEVAHTAVVAYKATSALELLLAHSKWDLNMESAGPTPLGLACMHRSPEAAQMLLDAGADVDACFGKGRWTALQTAAEHRSAPLITLLLQRRAQVNAQDIDGLSALHWAATSGSPKCVQLLLDAGADEALLTKTHGKREGKTPLECAFQAGHRLTVKKFNSQNLPEFFIPEPVVRTEPATELSKRARPFYAQLDGSDGDGESDDRRGAKRGGVGLLRGPLAPKREANLPGVVWRADLNGGGGKWQAIYEPTEDLQAVTCDGCVVMEGGQPMVLGDFDSRAAASEALAYTVRLICQLGQPVDQVVRGPAPLMPSQLPKEATRAKKGRGATTAAPAEPTHPAESMVATVLDPAVLTWWMGASGRQEGGKASQREAGEAEGEGAQQDDGLGCGICNEDSCSSRNQIICCEGCLISVHANCYGTDVPEGDWFCAPCIDTREAGRERDEEIARAARECRLCPTPGGALWRVADDAGGGYVHSVCCLVAGYFANPQNGCTDSVGGIQALAHARTETAVCGLCGDPYGAVVRCYHLDPQPPNNKKKRCAFVMHVSCAHLHNLGTAMSVQLVRNIDGEMPRRAEKNNRAGSSSRELIRHMCPAHFAIDDAPNLAIALEQAVRRRERAHVAELLCRGAHPDTFVAPWPRPGRGGGEASGSEDAGLCYPTGLHAAAALGELEMLEMMLALLERVYRRGGRNDDSDGAEEAHAWSVLQEHLVCCAKENVHSVLHAAAAADASEALLMLLHRLNPPPTPELLDELLERARRCARPAGGGAAPPHANEGRRRGAVGEVAAATLSNRQMERLLESRTGHMLCAWAGPGSFGTKPLLARDLADLAGGSERYPLKLVLGGERGSQLTEEGALRALGEFAYVTRPLPAAEVRLVEASKSTQGKLFGVFQPGVPLGAHVNIVYTGGERGFGVFAAEAIQTGTVVCVYAGVLIKRSAAKAMGDNVYMMDVGVSWTIDARQYRNVGAFVNFSCEPNLKVAPAPGWQLSSTSKWPVFVSTQRIEAGEELTYMRDKRALGKEGNCTCRCGKPSCGKTY